MLVDEKKKKCTKCRKLKTINNFRSKCQIYNTCVTKIRQSIDKEMYSLYY